MFESPPALVYLYKAACALWGLVGLVVCLFGYRIFKGILAIMGFLVCGWVAAGAGYAVSSGNDFVALIAGLIGGVVGAILFVVLYYIGVFLAGAGFVALVLNTCAEPTPPPLLVIILTSIGGVLALILQKFIIIVSTAFTGALLTVHSAFLLCYHWAPVIPHYQLRALSRLELLLLVAWLALGFTGVLVQYLATARRIPSEEREQVSAGKQGTGSKVLPQEKT